MEKTYSEKELKEKAQEVFEQFPNTNRVFATLDGNVFLMENRARLHAGKGRVIPLDRPIEDEGQEAAAETKLSAPERIKLIQEATSLEELDPFKDDTAKTVKAAYEAKLKELQNPE